MRIFYVYIWPVMVREYVCHPQLIRIIADNRTHAEDLLNDTIAQETYGMGAEWKQSEIFNEDDIERLQED